MGKSAQEREVTEAMKAAGERQLALCNPYFEDERDIVCQVYRAMERARAQEGC